MAWDVFISHASEDKAGVAEPLIALLQAKGLTVWFDKDEMTLGDSLRAKIDEGLAHSTFGLVILSPEFFAKEWTRSELDGLFARDVKKKTILPVLHNLTHEELLKHAPMLAGKFYVSTADGLEKVAEAIVKAVRKPSSVTASASVAPPASVPPPQPVDPPENPPLSPADLARIAPGIDAEAIEILKAAASSDGRIYAAENDFVYVVRVGRKRFGDDSPPSQKKYKEAMRQLIMSSYVDQSKSICEVNHRGYELYEKLIGK